VLQRIGSQGRMYGPLATLPDAPVFSYNASPRLPVYYRWERARLIDAIRAGVVPPDYALAAAARLDPPGRHTTSTGRVVYMARSAERPQVREARVAEIVRLSSQIRAGEPTLLITEEELQGAIATQDGFALRSDALEKYPEERGYRRLLQVGLTPLEGIALLREVVSVAYIKGSSDPVITPHIQVVSGAEQVLAYIEEALTTIGREMVLRQFRNEATTHADFIRTTELVAALCDIGWDARQLVPQAYLAHYRAVVRQQILYLDGISLSNLETDQRRATLAYYNLFTPEEHPMAVRELERAASQRPFRVGSSGFVGHIIRNVFGYPGRM
jgi:hypothetical protein